MAAALVATGGSGAAEAMTAHCQVASAIARVLRESTLARELSRAGRERARDFSWNVVAPRIEAVYERAR